VTDTLFERVRYHRQAAAVERCHLKPHALRYSVGHHTHDLVSLLLQCWKHAHEGELPRAELIVAAHVHDHPELTIGDVPSSVKDLLGATLDGVEERITKWLGCQTELTEEEALYLAAADRFELWLWCWEEMARGNVEVLCWAERCQARFEEAPLPRPFMELIDEVQAAGGVPHITPARANEIGGL
jgi:5'-deoxynucleotidase YfbR-like HD superfamily hydrolase